MRKSGAYLVGSIILIVACVIVYSAFINYKEDPELANFPIPTSAELDFKTDSSKHMYWQGTTGTELKFTYVIAIKRAGWKDVPVDGQMMQYVKNAKNVTVIPSTNYIEIIVEN